MWLTKRKRASAPEPSLEQLRAEISHLAGADDLDSQRRLIRLRHLAGIRVVEEAPAEPQYVSGEDVEVRAGDPLPEFTPAEVTAPLLRAAILRDGCLLVRGLLPRDRSEELARQIDRAFAERDKVGTGQAAEPGFYEEFDADERFGNDPGRLWVQAGGGLLAADSPRLCALMMELFRASGIPNLVDQYLGEPAVVSLHKTTLRKAEPQVSGAWHQDGVFMGPVRALNLWAALSPCGEDAPGLDLLPRRLDDYVATGTDDTKLNWTVSDAVVARVSRDEARVARPRFEPGDALLFDERFLHKTGSDLSMTRPRFAIESWFFGGSAFPPDYAPIAV